LLTVGKLLEGADIDLPPSRGNVTLKKAQRHQKKDGEQSALPLDE